MKREIWYIALEVLSVAGILAGLYLGYSLAEILTGILAVLAICLVVLGRRKKL